MGQDYNISMGNKFVQISGNANVIVGDDSGNSNLTLYVKGNVDMQVDGNVTEVIGGSVTQTVNGGGINIIANPGADGGVGAIGIDAGAQLDISSVGPMNLRSDSEIRLRAPMINLN